MKLTIRFMMFAGICFLVTSCAGDKPASQHDQVSSIPWNRPERWEGQGALGGFQQNR